MNRPLTKARSALRHRYVIAHQKRFAEFIFIHINKTGGSSIQQALGGMFEHRTAREKVADLGREVWDRLYTFAFVRNPWDRVVSHYHYRVQTDQTGLGEGRVDFQQWVRLAYGERDPRYYDKPKMFMAQADWVTDESGLVVVDFVGRFESLAEGFQMVCGELGRSVDLPHLKSSRRGDYRDYYDGPTQEIVADRFEEDIERFGYSFGGGPA